MPHALDRPRPPVDVIDLTLSEDDEPSPPLQPVAAPISRPPIPRPVIPPRTNNPLQNAPIAPAPSVSFNHGLLSHDFHSKGPWPHADSVVGPWLQAQVPQISRQNGSFTVARTSGENPAKRMRVGERPTSLSSPYFPTNQSATPEVPLNLLDQALPQSGTSTQQASYSAHNALNIVNEAAFPRKSTARKSFPTVNGGRVSSLHASRAHETNLSQTRQKLSPIETSLLRDVAPAKSNSSNSDVEILQWRKKESPQHEIIKHAQKMHVFPHVKHFLRQFGEGLPDDTIRRVGKEVVDKICDIDTVTMILANHGTVSMDCEAQIANRAHTMIKMELGKIKNRKTSAAVLGFKVGSPQSRTLNHSLSDLRGSSPLSGPVGRSLPGERSSSSSEIDSVFDRSLEINRPTPTTSPELSAESEKPNNRYIAASLTADDPTSFRQQEKPRRPPEFSIYALQKCILAEADSSEWSEETTSDDEDITADVQAYMKALKTPSAPNTPVEPNFGDVLPPAVVQLNLSRQRNLERDERRYRLFSLDPRCSRPYLCAQDRADVRRGLELANSPRSKVLSTDEKQALRNAVFHVDFAVEEMAYIADVITMILGMKPPAERRKLTALPDDITRLMKGKARYISKIVNAISFDGDKSSLPLALRLIKRRGKVAVTAFLEDATSGAISSTAELAVCSGRRPKVNLRTSETAINSLLRQRETFGKFRSSWAQREVKVELSNLVEDTIVPRRQWMDCSGDVIAIAWNSEGTSFVCGATAHSDSHNQQYNKPGNLIFGSIHSEVLRARPDHKIPRPVVVKGDNSLESMRETQDPWLYSSVVSAAYSLYNKAFFTSSFDKTVKVWGEGLDETQPELLGTWEHDGNVNFVVTSENHGLVATACDIVRDAIRVYELDDEDIDASPYITYSGMKANEQVAGEDKTWAYFPATIAWGKCPIVAQLLLVGYSPRSTGVDESDIPEDKCNLGELCLWDISTNERIDIWPRSQNVFEVVWHPTQPVFLAATAPIGMCEPWVRTQVRVFTLNEKGGFTQTKALDCCAIDINEITVMPNSNVSSYVTASCTDGKVYVWDTALGDDPIHVLEHGASIDDRHYIDLPNELSDNGVKFAGWGASIGRFYTGSSDGLVKAWDVRAPSGQAFIRDVARFSGGVSSGAFSPDLTRLLIGDATGKVHLLHIQDTESLEEPTKVFPKLVTPHPQPDEDSMWAGRGGEIGSELIRNSIIVLSRNKKVGAVQGPAYYALGWHCPTAHEDGDPRKPLVPADAVKQQVNRRHENKRRRSHPALLPVRESILAKFAKGKSKDLDLTKLDKETLSQLLKEGWVYEDQHDFEDADEMVMGGRLVKNLRKGEDWEEEWVELKEGEWIYLE